MSKDMRSFDDFCDECDSNDLEIFALQLQSNTARSLKPNTTSTTAMHHHHQRSLKSVQEKKELGIRDSSRTVDSFEYDEEKLCTVEHDEEKLMEQFQDTSKRHSMTTVQTEGYRTDKKHLETHEDMMMLLQIHHPEISRLKMNKLLFPPRNDSVQSRTKARPSCFIPSSDENQASYQSRVNDTSASAWTSPTGNPFQPNGPKPLGPLKPYEIRKQEADKQLMSKLVRVNSISSSSPSTIEAFSDPRRLYRDIRHPRNQFSMERIPEQSHLELLSQLKISPQTQDESTPQDENQPSLREHDMEDDKQIRGAQQLAGLLASQKTLQEKYPPLTSTTGVPYTITTSHYMNKLHPDSGVAFTDELSESVNASWDQGNQFQETFGSQEHQHWPRERYEDYAILNHSIPEGKHSPFEMEDRVDPRPLKPPSNRWPEKRSDPQPLKKGDESGKLLVGERDEQAHNPPAYLTKWDSVVSRSKSNPSIQAEDLEDRDDRQPSSVLKRPKKRRSENRISGMHGRENSHHEKHSSNEDHCRGHHSSERQRIERHRSKKQHTKDTPLNTTSKSKPAHSSSSESGSRASQPKQRTEPHFITVRNEGLVNGELKNTILDIEPDIDDFLEKEKAVWDT